ncbi:VSP [Giardia lamblia P15]|uniref:VSP n=1 Tax=Giardia intestinalis (strain P15) TaxID=658858 RepID=E1F8W0_GIAIA|nr:VSP [Giardia lamblia P15]
MLSAPWAVSSMFEKILFTSLILQAAWSACTDDTVAPGKCAKGKCDVTIGKTKYCSQCSTEGEAPVGGECVSVTEPGPAKQLCPQSVGGKCTQCAQDSFMFSGGCYQVKQEPASSLCTSTDRAGVCVIAASGYFVPPNANSRQPSVVSCSDTAGVILGGKTYKGVAECTRCTTEGLTSEGGAARCVACEGKKPNKAGTGCFTCSTPNCATCSADDTCETCTDGTTSSGSCAEAKAGCHATCINTKCESGHTIDKNKCKECKADAPYLKLASSAATYGECVTAAECTADGTHFTKDNVQINSSPIKVCLPCSDTKGITECQICMSEPDAAALSCNVCDAAKAPNTAGTQCFDCNIANCVKCDSPGTCAACGSGYILAKNKCEPCTVIGCKTCTDGGDGQTCTECMDSTQKISADKSKCVACGVENCVSCNEDDVCAQCAEGYEILDSGRTCTEKAAGKCKVSSCKACSKDKKTCTECEPGKHLTPTKKACLADCPAGTYLLEQACTPCDPSCAECSGAGASRCTACPAGKMLRYADEGKPTDGTCAEGCVEGPECEACGLTIGGTKYCSKCAADRWAPRNGVCADTAAARSPFCTSASGGACTQCAGGYFLQDGGCYQTTRLPGKSVCRTDNNSGKCRECANGLAAESDICPLCDSTCATCSVKSDPAKCKTCPPGRYLDAGNACKPCTETSGSIQGVADCVSCAPPSGDTGSVLCYLMKDDGTGGSTNKSGGLPPGAIAGIAVAAIVVIGGLVGFLCWWFLCRGKA